MTHILRELRGYIIPILMVVLLGSSASSCTKEDEPYVGKLEWRMVAAGIEENVSSLSEEEKILHGVFTQVFAKHGLPTGIWYSTTVTDLDKVLVALKEIEKVVEEMNYPFQGFYYFELFYKDQEIYGVRFGKPRED